VEESALLNPSPKCVHVTIPMCRSLNSGPFVPRTGHLGEDAGPFEPFGDGVPCRKLRDVFAERTFFSPVSKVDILDCSIDLIESAKSAVLISAPFGVDKTMETALLGNSAGTIEYGLVNATLSLRPRRRDAEHD
jgi:hypothetical protein